MLKNFITIRDLSHTSAWELLIHANDMKNNYCQDLCMKNKVAALIFEKASTRTRVSFEVAIYQLGGSTIFITPNESQIGRSEPLKDTARALSQYVDCIIIRTKEQERINEVVEFSSVPIINALTDQGHPCQVMADLLTIYERHPKLDVRIAWVGDGNNVLNSWIEAAMYFPFELFIAIPKGHEPDKDILGLALQVGAKIFLTHEPEMAVDEANYVYTDVWTSMGKEHEQKNRLKDFQGFCVDSKLMAKAAPEAKFLHCLPAHRGEEVSEDVMESSYSLIWEQAKNRLHIQKALLQWIFSEKNK